VSFIKELRRRNVFRVAVAYVITAWLLLQVVDILLPMLTLPEWVARFVLLLLLIGFPIAMLLAWAYELTPDGIKKESEVDRSESITTTTAQKLNTGIMVAMAIALVWFAFDKFIAGPDETAPAVAAAPPAADVETPDVAVPRPVEKSIAVLPFVAMSSGPDDEYFADGLTEEILNSLAQLPELLVTARTSAFSFKGQDVPIQSIAETLGVRHIVEGSVRRSGERLRVTAQLIRANDGFHLWSENYDSEATDAIAVQENIAEKIAAAMDVVLDEDSRAAMRMSGLRDVEAFVAYQKGNDYYDRAHGQMNQLEGLRLANEYYDEVIERVPEYPPAYIRRSDYFVHLLNNSVHADTLDERGEEEIAEILAAAQANWEAAFRHARTADERRIIELNLQFIRGNWRGLGSLLADALGQTHCGREGVWLSNVALMFGDTEAYRQYADSELACDRASNIAWFDASRAAFWNGDFEDGARLAREGADLTEGRWIYTELIRNLLAQGDVDAARQVIRNSSAGRDEAFVYETMIAASQGDQEVLDTLLADPPETLQRSVWYQPIFAWQGDLETANRIAARMDQHPFGPMTMLVMASWCGCGAPWTLDATPNFAALIKQGNLPWPPPEPLKYPLKDW
jgi:TolB-like protein